MKLNYSIILVHNTQVWIKMENGHFNIFPPLFITENMNSDLFTV